MFPTEKHQMIPTFIRPPVLRVWIVSARGFVFPTENKQLSCESVWQVAGLMAYGPLALGKGQYCPRDGRLDCSIVNALEASQLPGAGPEG